MKNTLITALILITLTPLAVFAQYKPLVNFGMTGSGSLDDLINGLYALSITIAALLAVIKIVVAGVKWMMSGDNASGISGAKKDIYGAIIGLIIVLGAVMILTVFNSDTVNFDFSLKDGIDSDNSLDKYKDTSN